jgi:hypothetical protein
MQDPIKRVEQFFFEVHSARPAEYRVQARLPYCPPQNPTIPDWCR